MPCNSQVYLCQCYWNVITYLKTSTRVKQYFQPQQKQRKLRCIRNSLDVKNNWWPRDTKWHWKNLVISGSDNGLSSFEWLRWRHNGPDSVSNHQPHDCLLNRLFRRRSKKTSKLRVTGLCAGNSPGPVNSPHKWPVTRKMFPFDDVIMWHLQNNSHLL